MRAGGATLPGAQRRLRLLASSEPLLAALLAALEAGPVSVSAFAAQHGFDGRAVLLALKAMRDRAEVQRHGHGVSSSWHLVSVVRAATPSDLVLGYVRRHPGCDRRTVAAALGLAMDVASGILANLSATNRAVCTGHGTEAVWYLPDALPAAPKGTPCLEPGRGVKRECARYEGCLDTFMRRFARFAMGEARCPKKCPAFEPFPKLVDLASATRARRSMWDAA